MDQTYRISALGDAFPEAIVQTIAQPLLVLDGNHRVLGTNRAFCRSFGICAEAAHGQLVYDLGAGEWNSSELRQLLAELVGEHDEVEEFRLEQTLEHRGRRVMLLNARRLPPSGSDARIVLAISDISEAERQRAELHGHQEFGEKLIDSIREGLLILDRDLRIHSANRSLYQQFHLEPSETEGKLIYELGQGEWNIPELRDLLEDIVPRQASFDDFEVTREFPRIGRRIMLLNARRLDSLQLIILAIRDVTDERDHLDRQETFMRELQHRVKNILSNVQALASQTRRHSRDLDEFFEAFEARLGALNRAQELLVSGPQNAVELAQIVHAELQAVGAHEGSDYTVAGPAIRLSQRDTQAMAMAIHELTTNAGKYGALHQAAGRIVVEWCVEEDSERRLSFHWRERDVTVSATERGKGFGSRMIEQSVPAMLDGTARLDIAADGASYAIDFPLAR